MNRVEIEFSDMPAWVQEQSALHVGKNKRPICYVEPVDRTASVGATWHDNARQVIVARRGNGQARAIKGGYYDSILNHTAEEFIGHQGGDFNLTRTDDAVLQISLYYKLNTITMYVRKDGPYMKLVNRVEDGEELSPLQVNVLRHLAGLNSGGRKNERTQYQIPKELIIAVSRELEEMGLCKVNKAQAITITTAGRNKYRALPKVEWSWRDWGDCVKYGRKDGRVVRVFTGFAGEIFRDYRDRMIAERR